MPDIHFNSTIHVKVVIVNTAATVMKWAVMGCHIKLTGMAILSIYMYKGIQELKHLNIVLIIEQATQNNRLACT